MRPEKINRWTFRERYEALLIPAGLLVPAVPVGPVVQVPSGISLVPPGADNKCRIVLQGMLDDGYRRNRLQLGLLALSREFGLDVEAFKACDASLSLRVVFREGEPGHIDSIVDLLEHHIRYKDSQLPVHLHNALEQVPATDPYWWTVRVKELQKLTWRVLALGQSAFIVKKNFPELCAQFKTKLNPYGINEVTLAKKSDPLSSYIGPIETYTQGSQMSLGPSSLVYAPYEKTLGSSEVTLASGYCGAAAMHGDAWPHYDSKWEEAK